ncbi:hypothetical protein P2H44_22765 [Albimonas sp. CAU 1670]|uniref:hypothetical protein n=1 Tax=Albimonas sp. CAU 1670 TaxID=3032599 RepID=UPI0023DB0F39|nr:hypothetical protein [Albimonas sp. CAU 1670]MDF2235388.1 hypothetical protein [Albimonas sp. CAU 1670]
MRTETKIRRVVGAPAKALERSSTGNRGAARQILKEARDLAAEARDGLVEQLEQLQAGHDAIVAALRDLDAPR